MLRKTNSKANRQQAVRDRRKRISAFSEEIMVDITELFNADEGADEIPIFEKQMPVDFISDLHNFSDDDNSDSSRGGSEPRCRRVPDIDAAGAVSLGKQIPGYETPPHKELMNQLPPFVDMIATGLPVDADAQPLSPVAAASVSTLDGRCEHITVPPGSTSAEAGRSLATAFGLAPNSFVLRNSAGAVVPLSAASLGGKFTIEVPSADAGGSEPSATCLKFLQEPPHSAAVWLHTKLTKKGDIAGSCSRHIFSPPPKVAISGSSSDESAAAAGGGGGGSASADNREVLLAQATVTLVDAAGQEAVDKHGKTVMHTGTPIISTDPLTNECSITWPEMAVLDTSRTVHGMAAKDLKVSAQECGGYRGAVGWFSLKVSVPGCDDLWLKTSAGQRAKIIVKNERNAALGWAEKEEGPYADHSRCVPSHVGADGKRLCRQGCGGGGGGGSSRHYCGSHGHGFMQIKTEPLSC